MGEIIGISSQADPKRDLNPKFTSLKETSSVLVPFTWGSLPPEKIHTNLPEYLTKLTYFLPEMKLQLDKASKSLE